MSLFRLTECGDGYHGSGPSLPQDLSGATNNLSYFGAYVGWIAQAKHLGRIVTGGMNCPALEIKLCVDIVNT